MRAKWTAVPPLLAAIALVTSLAGCAGDDGASERDQGISVVASTAVWGSVARAIVGEHASVTSILTSPAVDPHSFEASPADAAEIADASLVVFNGGQYDRWVSDVLGNEPNVPTVDAYSLLADRQQPTNEHVFYDPATAKAVAMQIAERLAAIDAAHADAYRANANEFGKRADEILAVERAIGRAHPGAAVVATEPVAHYLLVNAGVADKTPPGFTSAVEQDADPSPADLAATLDLIDTRQVSALLFNPQTETPVTRQLRDAAARASIPGVTVTETLPAGTDFLTWQRQTAEQLASQLDKAPAANR